ncbi:MAG: hypothetical protein ACXWOX_22605, partial [Ktedonobacteraceae bacterium]
SLAQRDGSPPGEMELSHTSAILGVCPCYQLRAHESRTEERILWIGSYCFRSTVHMIIATVS